MIKKFIIKKIFVLAALVSVQNFCVFAEDKVNIRETPCEYRTVRLGNLDNVNYYISEKACRYDLEYLCYLLSTGYSGYSDMLQNGFRPEKFIQDVLSGVKTKGRRVDTEDFIEQIVKNLKFYINDGHFSFETGIKTERVFTKKKIYWSDIYLEKKNKEFFVKDGNGLVLNGAHYPADIETLFYYPLKGENVFRLGCLSSEPIESKEFKFNGKPVVVPLVDDGVIPEVSIKYKELQTVDSAYICLNFFILPNFNSFYYSGTEVMMKKFVLCGRKFFDKKNIVLDFRGNHGGWLFTPFAFFTWLYNGYVDNDPSDFYDIIDSELNKYMNYERIISPASLQYSYLSARKSKEFSKESKYRSKVKESKKKPVRKIKYNAGGEVVLLNGESRFQGKIIILIDRNSASSAENAVCLAKRIFGNDNVVVIGENSSGVAMYYAGIYLNLPRSKVCVNFGTNRNYEIESFDLWNGEGTGVFPDCWATRNDLNELIYSITKDEELKVELKTIGSNLM